MNMSCMRPLAKSVVFSAILGLVSLPLSAAESIYLEIKSDLAGPALMKLANAAHVQILVPENIAESVTLSALSGEYSLEDALRNMLANTGLSYKFTSERSVVIDSVVKAEGPSLESEKNVKENIDEIIVTAKKRTQSLQDSSMSISALGNEEIERRSLVGMSDYLSSIPGVNAQSFAPGANKIIMRGVGSGLFEDATVSMYFGEVPVNVLAPNSAVAGSSTDLKLVDVERIEVLRGPQGTLYGSGSMGGAVRNIPATPDLTELSGNLKAGYSNTAGAGGSNTKITGTINIPLIEDELALRIVAYNYNNSGYIRNIGASDPATVDFANLQGATVSNNGQAGSSDYTGGRATLLWQPSEQLKVSLMALTQELEQDGLLRHNLALGAYEANPLDVQPLDSRGELAADNTDIYNLVVEYDFGSVSLLSSSSWLDGLTERVFDLNRFIPIAAAIRDEWGREGFVQEIRLSSHRDGQLQFVGGVYYEDLDAYRAAKSEWIGNDALCCGFLGPVDPDNVFTLNDGVTIEQKAIFGEVSYEFAEQFMATIGGRWFDYSRGNTEHRSGAFNGGVSTSRMLDSDETGTNFMANLTYTPNEDTLIYAQWSQGFRLGRPAPVAPASVCDINNDGLLDGTSVPVDAGDLESDTLDSYELGAKLTLLDSRLILNTAIYRIEWNGIPVSVNATPSCGFQVQINAGEAVSKGMEFESIYYLTEGIRLNLGGSYVNAELSKDSANLGPKGTRMPGAPKWNASAGLQYEFMVVDRDAFWRTDYAYIGGYQDDIAATFPEVGGYGTLSMRAGINFDKLTLELYGTNLTNVDDLMAVQFSKEVFRLTPRTIGIELGYRF